MSIFLSPRKTPAAAACLLLIGSQAGPALAEAEKPWHRPAAAARIAAHVDGHPVVEGEVRIHLAANRGKSSLPERAAGQAHDPAARWLARSVAEAIYAKVEQIEMLERGLLEDIRFQAFQVQHASENSRRQRVHRRGGVVYGPIEYSLEAAYRRRIALGRNDIIRELACGPFAQEEIEAFYREHRDRLYRHTYRARFVGPEKARYLPLPEVAGHIVWRLAKQRYQSMIRDRIQRASIQLNPAYFAAMPAEMSDIAAEVRAFGERMEVDQ